MTAEQVAKQKKKVEMNLDEYEDNLNDLWTIHSIEPFQIIQHQSDACVAYSW